MACALEAALLAQVVASNVVDAWLSYLQHRRHLRVGAQHPMKTELAHRTASKHAAEVAASASLAAVVAAAAVVVVVAAVVVAVVAAVVREG